jgi:staphylococcal nuclease domain-containing protein 1
VKDGSTVRVRLLMPDGEHQFINLSLAGVRSPRVSTKPGEVSEPWSEEVRFRSSPSQRNLLIAKRFIG